MIKLAFKKRIIGDVALNQDDEYFWHHHAQSKSRYMESFREHRYSEGIETRHWKLVNIGFAGDTMTLIDRDTMDMNSVLWTVVTYVVANLEDQLPREGDYPDV